MEPQLTTDAPVAKPPSRTVFVRVFPPELWRLLKIRAAHEGRTLQATLARAIQHYLDTPLQ